MTRLIDLEPQWLRYEMQPNTWTERQPDGTDREVSGMRAHFVKVDTLAKAHGIKFLCPKCFVERGTAAGTHAVICWSRSRGTPDDAQPGPGRWALAGTDFYDLTLNADPPSTARSVLLSGGCGWHGHITDGVAE